MMAIRISNHARMQACARLAQVWQKHGQEGFSAWFKRLATEAVTRGRVTAPDRRVYRRIEFVYDFATDPVTLITVIVPDRKRGPRFGRTRLVQLTREAEERLDRSARFARGDE